MPVAGQTISRETGFSVTAYGDPVWGELTGNATFQGVRKFRKLRWATNIQVDSVIPI
jgi:hypothetical protein